MLMPENLLPARIHFDIANSVFNMFGRCILGEKVDVSYKPRHVQQRQAIPNEIVEHCTKHWDNIFVIWLIIICIFGAVFF